MRKKLLCLQLMALFGTQPVWADTTSSPPVSPTMGKQQVEAGTPGSTPAGTTFIIPDGWRMTTKGSLVVLSPVEPDFKFALIDVDAKDSASAVAAGWIAFDPGFQRPLLDTEPMAPRNGWDEHETFHYKVSPNEKLDIEAWTWRAGTKWFVAMLESSDATLARRRGPFGLLASSLRPKGYQRESFAGRAAHPIDAQIINSMRRFLRNAMRQLQIPGVAFSLIDGGKIVYEGGLGVRELGKADRIDADTLFLAASNTKALTTLMLAELVDEKKLRWDEPVVEAYPSFKLGDATITRTVRIKDLVCACTGMPRRDFEWLFDDGRGTPETMMQSLSTMQPTSKFGEVFQYSNTMAAAAGYVGASIAIPGKELGAAYDEAMQRRILDPLGMSRSTFDYAKAMQGDYARPHDQDIDGDTVVTPITYNYAGIPLRPSNGLWTSAHDLSQYVMLELAKGKLPNGQRLVSEENLLQRRVPNVVKGEDDDYGMGLEIDKSWGVTVIHHGGSMAGYKSDMIWFPDYNVGAVILTNSNHGEDLLGPFRRKLAELLFDGKLEADGQIAAAVADNDIQDALYRVRLQVPADPVASGKLAARYVNPVLGPIVVTHNGADVYFHAGMLNAEVASRRNDDGSTSFIVISPNLARGRVYTVGELDHKRTLTLRDDQHEYVFVEQ
ncbi:MAG: beta-lactamase family protein [Proteobacteria bacterium]|nr:beta-lactamase family protein [Pseudomonadota bacterium]